MNNQQNPGKSGMGNNQDSKRSEPRKADDQQIGHDRTQKRDPLGEDEIGPDRE